MLIISAAVVLAAFAMGRSARTATALGATAATPALAIHIGTASAHFFVLVSGLWLLTHLYKIRRLRLNKVHAVLIAACVPLLATVAWGPFVTDPNLALALVGLGASSIVVSELSQRHRQRMSRSFVLMNTFGCALALLQTMGAVSSQLIHQEISTIGRPSGWYGEPDWLGLFAGVNILACLYDRSIGSRVRVLGLAFGTTALLLSFARAAWLGVIAGVLLHLLLARSARTAARAKTGAARYAVVVGVIALLAWAPVPSLRSDLSTRAASIVGGGGEDVSGNARELQRDSLLRLADEAPWFGGGMSASGRVGVSGRLILEGESNNSVGSNWILALWVDGKFLALPLIAAFLGLVLYQRGSNYWPAFVALLVSSLASNAFYFPLTWFLVGMVAASSRPDRVSQTRGALVA